MKQLKLWMFWSASLCELTHLKVKNVVWVEPMLCVLGDPKFLEKHPYCKKKKILNRHMLVIQSEASCIEQNEQQLEPAVILIRRLTYLTDKNDLNICTVSVGLRPSMENRANWWMKKMLIHSTSIFSILIYFTCVLFQKCIVIWVIITHVQYLIIRYLMHCSISLPSRLSIIRYWWMRSIKSFFKMHCSISRRKWSLCKIKETQFKIFFNTLMAICKKRIQVK